MKKTISFQIDTESAVYKKLMARAKAEHRSVSNAIVTILSIVLIKKCQEVKVSPNVSEVL